MVRVVARNIEKVSTRLVEVAEMVAEAMEDEEGGGHPKQKVQEDTEILRRNWSSQARLPSSSLEQLEQTNHHLSRRSTS